MMIGAFATIGITIGVILLARRGQKVYLMCWLVYCIFLFPTVAGLSSGMQAQADRFSYLPMIPLFLLVAGGLIVLLRRGTAFGRLLLPISILVMAAGFASITIRQSERWESSESLWRYVVESFPPAPDYVDAYVNLGAVYAARMDLPDAEDVLTKAIEIDSLNADAFYNLGHVLYLRGEWEGAVRRFEEATEVDSGYAPAYYNLAIVSSQLGRDSVAIPAMRRAAALGYREASEALRQAGIHPDDSGGTIPIE
jgi:tetratricopeptide (TPR) repeat protein